MIENKFILISVKEQKMTCYAQDNIFCTYLISSGKNGVGEQINSECTPRGWHQIHAKIGMDLPINSVLVGRKWTEEIYSEH